MAVEEEATLMEQILVDFGIGVDQRVVWCMLDWMTMKILVRV